MTSEDPPRKKQRVTSEDVKSWELPMRAALEEAQLSIDNKNHPFGAVLVLNNEIVLRAQNTVVTDKDPTCHAEQNLVRLACKSFDAKTLGSSTVVTSTEPCPMCAGAIYWAGIGQVVFGCSGADLGKISGEELQLTCSDVVSKGILHSVNVIGPVLDTECAEMHKKFWPSWSGAHFGEDPK
eukprot:gnl/MRDRNA2_/MRDRNA2_140357_c0_seq1.p1 gnl/MRDRNA2_/MRDRNA2_140357_c0~~gnl/MRDRNA2_/MRDRNA2_140357_c0_seq1.p1  ORF type:complete len:181 (+),score=34.78 gnl/MRDRNA2_/MRDRNA2_140357_c0_seq1:147-689(+)